MQDHQLVGQKPTSSTLRLQQMDCVSGRSSVPSSPLSSPFLGCVQSFTRRPSLSFLQWRTCGT